jgi:hypothetical protein
MGMNLVFLSRDPLDHHQLVLVTGRRQPAAQSVSTRSSAASSTRSPSALAR